VPGLRDQTLFRQRPQTLDVNGAAERTDGIGQTLRMDGRLYSVVGVMPAGFHFAFPKVRLWTPLALKAEEKPQHHNNNFDNAGRLQAGVRIAQVQAR
jgi:hypothetical protein